MISRDDQSCMTQLSVIWTQHKTAAQCFDHCMISHPVSVFLKQMLTFQTSQSPFIQASLASLTFYMASGILCEFQKWTLTFRTSQSPCLLTQHCTLRKLFLNYCHYISLNRPSHHRLSKSFVPLKGNGTFSASLSQVKNKEWWISVGRSNWNGSMMPSGGALKNSLILVIIPKVFFWWIHQTAVFVHY